MRPPENYKDMETDYAVGIVGAGFAGLSAALRLKKSRQDSFVIFERAAEVGGTWRDNIYPGCACDVASPLYSFAGEPNPGWTQLYAGQPEIWAYLKHVVDKNDLRKHIRFGSDIVEAKFLEHRGCWLVTDRQGYQTTVRVLLLGMGPLNRPFLPQLPGLDAYKGAAFHSSAWDAACDLTGKRVGVIGTGASAIQIVPAVASEAGHLTVFQRTPAWVSHRFDAPVGERTRGLYSRFPLVLRLRREFIYWLSELLGFGFTGNRVINRLMEWISRWKLAKEVQDPEIRQKLTPAYQIGCKRILRSDDYYPTFNRPNVSLVTTAISRFLPHGILTADGAEHPLDVVIFATGFVAADINVYLRVTGLQGRNLIEEWKSAGAEAYLGTTVSGFPNLAFILGPNTGLGHNSVVHMMESQVHYLMQYLDFLRNRGGGSYLDVKPEVQQAYNQKIQKKFAGTVWVSGCKSWYTNAAGKNTTLFPRLTVAFRRLTRKFDPTAYHLIGQGEKAVVTDPVAV
jgi:cation diffusion facilitator CzcD-associated flavoprotein CzcO